MKGRTICKPCREKYLTNYRKINRTKVLTRKQKWKKNNPDKVKSSALMSDYGINLDTYNLMLIGQNYCCAICKRHRSNFKKALHVDHCHTTNKIRGLLCLSCNRALGLLTDNKEYFKSAAAYLEKHEEESP